MCTWNYIEKALDTAKHPSLGVHTARGLEVIPDIHNLVLDLRPQSRGRAVFQCRIMGARQETIVGNALVEEMHHLLRAGRRAPVAHELTRYGEQGENVHACSAHAVICIVRGTNIEGACCALST